MVGLVGVAPYQPDGRQTENILLMYYPNKAETTG
jgi:hypothetical protein